MKAYQVHTGEENKHGHQVFDLASTYLSEDKALEHCQRIVSEYKKLNEEVIEEHEEENGEWVIWVSCGWSYITICKMNKIEITE